MDHGFACDTLELPWHSNERGRSCTIADTYRGRVWRSPMLGRLVVRLEDKHGRHDCLIHNGNWAADTEDLNGDGIAEVTQVHGCTEVGHGFGDLLRKDGRKQWGIMHSVPTLESLIAGLRDASQPGGYHEVLIAYRWEAGCAPEETR